MAKDQSQNGASVKTPAQIREDIAETRRELGDTVAELSAKTDVKARAKEKADQFDAKDWTRQNPWAPALAAVVLVLYLRRRSKRDN